MRLKDSNNKVLCVLKCVNGAELDVNATFKDRARSGFHQMNQWDNSRVFQVTLDPSFGQYQKSYLDFVHFLVHGGPHQLRPPTCAELKFPGDSIGFLVPPEDPGTKVDLTTPLFVCIPNDVELPPPRALTLPPIQAASVVQHSRGAHPSFLRTLGSNHAEFKWGAFAELIHNSYDAKATKCEISLHRVSPPVIRIKDNGVGMSHNDIQMMLTIGHEHTNDPNRVGHYGIGFKQGSMAIGQDVVILTRTKTSISIGLLSVSYNVGKSQLETPIATYKIVGEDESIEPDTEYNSEEVLEQSLRDICSKSFLRSRENIGQLIGSEWPKGSTGTTILIENLGPNCSFEFDLVNKDIVHKQPNWFRARIGVVAKEIPLDRSLRSYCEVMFLRPCMAIEILKEPVQFRPDKLLVNMQSYEMDGVRIGIGEVPQWEALMLRGMMLYWHNVLIESYHTVGGERSNPTADVGKIGMAELNDCAVEHNKQRFQESEAFQRSIEKIAHMWDEHVLKSVKHLKVVTDKYDSSSKADWLQCSSCGKWRIVPPEMCQEFSGNREWTCRMLLSKGCEAPAEEYKENPEEAEDGDHITISVPTHSSRIKRIKSFFDTPEPARQSVEPFVAPTPLQLPQPKRSRQLDGLLETAISSNGDKKRKLTTTIGQSRTGVKQQKADPKPQVLDPKPQALDPKQQKARKSAGGQVPLVEGSANATTHPPSRGPDSEVGRQKLVKSKPA